MKPTNKERRAAIGGPLPFGYILKDDLTIMIDTHRARAVQKIFILHQEGQSPEQIANELNKGFRDGIRYTFIASPHGDLWTHRTVKNILKNGAKYQGNERHASGHTWPVILDQEPARAS